MDKTGKAWIFDLDGTLVDTQGPFHAKAEAMVLAKHGIIVEPEEISRRFSGVHTLEVFRKLAPEYPNPCALLREKWEYMKGMTISNPIKPIDRAPYLIHQLHDRGIPMGIASASPIFWIVMCLMSIHVAPYFKCYTSVDEVKEGKPAPDVFWLAAQRLGYKPEDCIVIEDGKVGVRAGLTAGMETYWLTKSEEVIPGAVKIRSLTELI